jgi:hypothetical protein
LLLRKAREKHWVDGRSAKECARAWCGPTGASVPNEILSLFAQKTLFSDLEFLWATPEHRVRFDSFEGEPRNSDMVAVASSPLGKVAVSIEAKADEAFGERVIDVLEAGVKKIAADHNTNSIARVQTLARALLPPKVNPTPKLGTLRYQLLTATAGAIAFAIEQNASAAVLIVHEFHTSKTSVENLERNAEDLNAFVRRLTNEETRSLSPGDLLGPIHVPAQPLFRSQVDLFIGKAVRQIAEDGAERKSAFDDD